MWLYINGTGYSNDYITTNQKLYLEDTVVLSASMEIGELYFHDASQGVSKASGGPDLGGGVKGQSAWGITKFQKNG